MANFDFLDKHASDNTGHKSIFDYPGNWTISHITAVKYQVLSRLSNKCLSRTDDMSERERIELVSLTKAHQALQEVDYTNRVLTIDQIPRTLKEVTNTDEFRWWFMGARLKRKLSFATIAEKAGCDLSVVSDLEGKGVLPSQEILTAILQTLDNRLTVRKAASVYQHIAELPAAPQAQKRVCSNNVAVYKNGLKEKREASGLSIHALASRMGVQDHYIQDYECFLNNHAPSGRILKKIAAALGLKPDEIKLLQNLRVAAQQATPKQSRPTQAAQKRAMHQAVKDARGWR